MDEIRENDIVQETKKSIEIGKSLLIAWKKFVTYLIKTMNGMAYGLFATLIIGVIVDTIGGLIKVDALVELGKILKGLMGVGIGIGVAWSLKLDGLKLIAGGICGGIAASVKSDPVVCYIATVVSLEILNLILKKKTPVDIIIIPLITSLLAFSVAKIIGEPVTVMMNGIANFIKKATEAQPFFMGIIIAVVMGMALTAPISSAAIAISLGPTFSGIAAGAAVVGCCVQMLGFAVMSRKDNNIGMVISVGIGTSMLQFKNILKKPIVWLPTIIVSAILGPISTLVFKAACDYTGAGMGTSGLVGLFATYTAMGNTKEFYLTLILLEIILPIVLVYIVDIIFRKVGLIKEGDLKI